MTAATYDFKNVICTCGGFQIQGFAEGGTGITIDRNEDAWTTHIGGDGESARGKSNNRSGRVTLALLQTSPSNDVLQAFANADELGNAGTFPLLIKDLLGNTLVVAEQAWVVKEPTSEFGPEVGTREWILETGELVMNVGGN